MSNSLPYTAQKKQKDKFWIDSELTNTKRRGEPGTKKYQNIVDLQHGTGSFRGMRRFKNKKTEEKRITVEIEFKNLI